VGAGVGLYRRRRARDGRRAAASANPARGTVAASRRESRGRAGSRGVREVYEEASVFPRRGRGRSRRRPVAGVCARAWEVSPGRARPWTDGLQVSGLVHVWARGEGQGGSKEVGCGPD
jgi:hypothetical protein